MQCLSYLDNNTLLFGVLPAVHSLPSVTASLFGRSDGRRVLLSRFGGCSDAALWSEELLAEWRLSEFSKQRAEVEKRYTFADVNKAIIDKVVEPLKRGAASAQARGALGSRPRPAESRQQVPRPRHAAEEGGYTAAALPTVTSRYPTAARRLCTRSNSGYSATDVPDSA